MATVSKSFTAVGTGLELLVKHGDQFTYSISGTYAATTHVEKSTNGGLSWEVLVTNSTANATVTGTIVSEVTGGGSANYRVRCSAFTSGTCVTSIADVTTEPIIGSEIKDKNGVTIFRATESGVEITGSVTATGSMTAAGSETVVTTTGTQTLTNKTLTSPAINALTYHAFFSHGAAVGGTAGWVVNAATNVGRMATVPAGQTGSTLKVNLSGLPRNLTITEFYLVGQIESGGNVVTLDANLRKLTAAAADLVDASVATMTQVSVTADTALSTSTAIKSGLTAAVDVAESYYVLLTATTGASTDIDLMGVGVIGTLSYPAPE